MPFLPVRLLPFESAVNGSFVSIMLFLPSLAILSDQWRSSRVLLMFSPVFSFLSSVSLHHLYSSVAEDTNMECSCGSDSRCI